MSAELRYRVYDKVEKCYSDKAFSIDQYGDCYVQDEEGYWEEIDEERYVVEQYTGLKDKNGKRVCQGDIVLVANHGRTPYVVTYREWDCSFVCENENLVDFVHMFKTMPQCYEVIGNIHENPELLERSKENESQG